MNTLTWEQMQALEDEGLYHTWPSYIGGHGTFWFADPIDRTGPRYEFDAARQVWRAIPQPQEVSDDGLE